MSFFSGFVFTSIELVFIGLALLALVRLGFMRLDSKFGIYRDGIPPGKAAPSWSGSDLDGRLHTTPTRSRWQMLIFGDRSLVAVPDLVTGINQLANEVNQLEILVLSRDSPELCDVMVQGLGVHVPVVPVGQSLYHRFNVRVMPFAVLLDPQGQVHWVGLVNSQAQLRHAWNITRAIEQTLA